MRKIKKSLLALSFVLAFASVIGTLSPLYSSTAKAAPTAEFIKTCYEQFNGKYARQVSAGDRQSECITADNAVCTGGDPYKCQATPLPAQAAEAAPLVTAVCGTQPVDGPVSLARFDQCRLAVKGAYESCAYPGKVAYNTNWAAIDATVTCATPKLNAIAGGKKVTAAAVTTAVQAGRNESKKETEEAAAVAETDAAMKECVDSGGTWEENKCTPASTGTPCSGGALGWIICPLSELFVNVTNFFATIIESMMVFSPLLNSPQGTAIKAVWQVVVNIANVLLVVAFLAVVFSQATSIGLSSYGIKKMLPKIIAAAILMNLSFYLCAFAIDIANILGQSMAAIIRVGLNALPAPGSESLAADVRTASTSDYVLSGTVAVLTGVTVGVVAPGLFLAILPLLASAAVAMFTAFMVIVFRQVAIVILIILSPLAFAAWILPNTEVWFTRWRKFFIALLLMFPLTMVIFHGAIFLSNVIVITLDPSDAGPQRWVTQIMALAVLVIPLFALPFIMKAAGGILEKFGVLTNNKQRGLIDRTRNWSKPTQARMNANRRASIVAGANKLGMDKDGNPIDTKGAAGLRRLGRSANFVAGYGARREFKLANQQENAKRIQNEEIFSILAETDSEGKPTARAEAYAARAAGAGGDKNAERIRRLALEQQKKAHIEDVSRESSAFVSAGVTDAGAYYYEFDDKGNAITAYSDHGRAMTALARGDVNLGVIKAGEARTADNARKNIVKGDNVYKRDAAIKRLWDIGDGNGLGLSLYGGKHTNDLTGADEYVAPIADAAFSGAVQWMDAGKIAPKLSHLVTNDNGLNGISGDAMVNWHGNEFMAAGSRVRQLREQGNFKEANAIQDAVEKAYANLSKNPDLAKDFKQKHVNAMKRFNQIITGGEGRAILREYGDSTVTMAAAGKVDKENRYTDTGGVRMDASGAPVVLAIADPAAGTPYK